MTATITYEVGTIAHVDPRSLIIERNIRDAKPDAALVDSIRAVGVLEPITGVPRQDGTLAVRFGHRRTLAAIQAARESVPVFIAAPDDGTDEAEARRIIAQRDENTHRAGLTTSEEIAVVEQLAGLGLSAAQIAKQARVSREHVKNALAIAGSETAKQQAASDIPLTLDQAATLAEFEDEPEAVAALVEAAGKGTFEHTAQRKRDDKWRQLRTAAVIADAEAAGLTVVERPSYDDKTTKPLHSLSASAEDTTPLTEEAHRQCPGHVVWIEFDWVSVDQGGEPLQMPEEPAEDAGEDAWAAYEAECSRREEDSRRVQAPVLASGCAQWRTQGHNDRYHYGEAKKTAAEMTDEERAAAKAARALVIENNKAWSAATPVRREHLAGLAKAKTAPKDTARFLATALSADASIIASVAGNHLAATLLGNKSASQYGRTNVSPAKTATDAKCLVHALVIVLAAYEESLTDSTWRDNGEHNAAGRYLRFLAEKGGYSLSDVEAYAISSQTA